MAMKSNWRAKKALRAKKARDGIWDEVDCKITPQHFFIPGDGGGRLKVSASDKLMSLNIDEYDFTYNIY